MAGLEGTVNVPVAGKVPKKEAAIGIVVVVTLIIVYYVRSKSSSSSASTTGAAAATSTDQYPPDGTTGNPQDPYSTDPATGQTYGNESVGSGGTYGAYGGLGSGSYGSYPWDGSYGNTSDPYSLDPSTGQTYGNEGYYSGGGTTGTSTGGPPFSTNEQWSSYVLQQEQSLNPSVSIGAWQDALGLYLNGQPVSASQKTIIFEAQSIAGNPPVAGTNNYPPNIRTNGGKGGQTSVTVPNVTGDRADDARQALRAAGLAYNISDTATGTVTAQSPKAGANVNSGSTVKLTLKSGTTSGGGTTVRVPNVVGKRQVDAGPVIRQAGLVASFEQKAQFNTSGKGVEQIVQSQNPAAGAQVSKGSTVTMITAGASSVPKKK